jgi:hypothetical protein
MEKDLKGISLIELTEDVEIYRFITLPQLMNSFELNKFSLRKVLEWEDSWEVPTKFFWTKM